MAEVKRARRREKEAFLKNILTANNGAAAQGAAQRKKVTGAAGDTTGASKRRPPREHRMEKEPKQDAAGAGEGATAGGEKSGRAWPYGPVCVVAQRRERGPGSRRRSGESGEGCSTRESQCSAADGGAVGAAGSDSAQPVPLKADGNVAPGIVAENAGAAVADASDSSPVSSTGALADKQEIEDHSAGDEDGKRSSGCARKQGDRGQPDGHQQPQLDVIIEGANESGSVATNQETIPKAATPSPVVTSSVRVVDMGVVRPSE